MLQEPLLSRNKQLSADQIYYINHQPKILLEIISARTTFLILLLTYCSFIACFTVDIVNTSVAFTNSNTVLHPAPEPYVSNYRNNKYSWNTSVYHLRNVISAQLTISQTNFTTITNWTSLSTMTGPPDEPPDSRCPIITTIRFDVVLWACYQSDGCSDFSTSPTNNHKHTWHESLRLTQQELVIDLCPLVFEQSITKSLFPNTLQNQEAIPTNGVVKSYFIQVFIYDNGYQLFIPTTPAVAESINYSVRIVSRHGILIRAATIILTICIFIVTGSLIAFIRIMYRHQPNPRKWLPEQQWIILYLSSLIFYLNPVYCVVFWYKESMPSAIVAYITYVLDAIGQSSVFLIWLFLADPLSCRFRHWVEFYLPKIFLVFWIFLSYIVVVTYQFPSIANMLVPQSRSPVQAVNNWPKSTQRAFVGFSILYLILQGVWFFLWFAYLWITSCKLRKLPYMSTRYIQLSFRFFTLQATLVTLYYVFQYTTVIYYLVHSTHTNSPTVTQLADDVNTLFKEQTQTAGKLVFLSIYALILAFLFLPSSEGEKARLDYNDSGNKSISNSSTDSIAAKLAVTYVITEQQLKKAVCNRKKIIQHLNVMQQSLLSNITTYQPYVFCAELTVILCQASYEVYYEHVSVSNKSKINNNIRSISNDTNNTIIDDMDSADSKNSSVDITAAKDKSERASSNRNIVIKNNEEMKNHQRRHQTSTLLLPPSDSDSINAVNNVPSSSTAPPRQMNLESLGYEYIASRNDEAHDTFCCIARHIVSRKLLIIFRGASSKKHWNSNLQFRQKPVDILRDKPTCNLLPPIDIINAASTRHTSDNQAIANRMDVDNNIKKVQDIIIHEDERVDDKQEDENKEDSDGTTDEEFSLLNISSLKRNDTQDIKNTDDKKSSHFINPNDQHTEDDDRTQQLEQENASNDDEADDDFLEAQYVPQSLSSSSSSSSSPQKNRYKKMNKKQQHSSKKGMTDRLFTAGKKAVKGSVRAVTNTALGATATAAGVATAVGAGAGEIVIAAVEQMPVLKTMLIPNIHTGFWEAYSVVREFIHTTIRQELHNEFTASNDNSNVVSNKVTDTILVTGHSLGGALATLCALDLTLHTVMDANIQLERLHHQQQLQRKQINQQRSKVSMSLNKAVNPNPALNLKTRMLSQSIDIPSISSGNSNNHNHKKQAVSKEDQSQQHQQSQETPHPHHRQYLPSAIHVSMYNFGAPRVGNRAFAQLYDKIVPDSFRVTVDGDIIPSLPPSFRFKHVGTEVLIDGMGLSGSIIIDPSFVEKRLISATKASVAAHSLDVHRKGLLSVIESANYISSQL